MDKIETVYASARDHVDSLIAEQKRLDTERDAMADEIIAGQHVTSVEEGLRFARGWITTAAQYAANADYFQSERDKLLRVINQANDHLFDSSVDDVEHQIDSHADTLPEAFRRVAAGHAAARPPERSQHTSGPAPRHVRVSWHALRHRMS